MSVKSVRPSQWISLLFGLLLVYSVFIEPYWVRIREIEISEEPFASFFRDHKTIFLSDIHVTNSGIREKLLLEKISQLSAEIILLGGDLVAWNGDYQAAFGFLGKLKARKGVYGVLGESDFQDNRKSCNFCHHFDKSLPPFTTKFLQNKAVHLSPSEPAIFGLDMGSLEPGLKHRTGLSTLKEPAIILCHKQTACDEIPDVPVLVLSGDTHGGQFWMPDWFWGWIFGESKGSIRKGIRRSGNKTFLVISGIGTNHIPFRFLCPPEVILLKGK
jgi:hypothetical protein